MLMAFDDIYTEMTGEMRDI